MYYSPHSHLALAQAREDRPAPARPRRAAKPASWDERHPLLRRLVVALRREPATA